MIWQVCVSRRGVEQQLCLGDNDKIARAQRSFMHKYDKLLIKYLFNGWKASQVTDSTWYKGTIYEKEIRDGLSEIAKKYGAGEVYGAQYGYNMRKSTLEDYVEVLADLDAKDYSEFHKKYPGLEGAIDILHSSERVLHGAGNDAAKAVNRMVKKLQFEISEED